jgi:hypothetical protein
MSFSPNGIPGSGPRYPPAMISRFAVRTRYARLFRCRQEKGVGLRVERRDAREHRFGELARREPTPLDQSGRIGDRQPMQVGR